jgi:hypothetical protein
MQRFSWVKKAFFHVRAKRSEFKNPQKPFMTNHFFTRDKIIGQKTV